MGNIKGKKVHFAENISIHTFLPKPDHLEKADETTVMSTPPKPVQRLGLRKRLQKSSTSEPSKSSTQQNPNNMRNKKDQFFASMIPDPKPISSESEDDLEVLGSVDANDFIFNPLTVPVRKAICVCLNMPFCKQHLNHENIGEELYDRNPKVKSILGDGNCLFCALSVAMTGWETSHLAFCQLICEHILEVGPYTNNHPSKYLNNMKMRSLKVFGTDVEIMAAAQIIGVIFMSITHMENPEMAPISMRTFLLCRIQCHLS